MKSLTPLPPSYMYHATCAQCWEPFTRGWLSRWVHRRRWGHAPEEMYPHRGPSHEDNVRDAEQWRRTHGREA